MGFFKSYRNRMLTHASADSIAALNSIENYFDGGARWIKGAYHTKDGKCVVGAANHVQQTERLKLANPKHWIRQAIAERQGSVSPVFGIEGFNDTRASYSEIAEVMERAKQLALEHRRAQQAPARPALTYQPEDDQRPVVEVSMDDLERVAVLSRPQRKPSNNHD
jgi:hypothetical protein